LSNDTRIFVHDSDATRCERNLTNDSPRLDPSSQQKFDVQIFEVRTATPQEIAHGHAHGDGGHDH
jgi:FKBP-type peptidyl-prolyl cis-trans isomerase SlyD